MPQAPGLSANQTSLFSVPGYEHFKAISSRYRMSIDSWTKQNNKHLVSRGDANNTFRCIHS
jgi:hypothetical protein